MMEEMSMIMAYDAQLMEQMTEEEILACLVPTEEVTLKESRLQIMDDEEEPSERYQRENHRLQQASLRLEQENDNLANRLIISKVALRNALDKAEDRVDELTKDLFQTRHELQATEDEKREREEEAAVSKEVFRRELQKTEEEVRRQSGIIAEYKQICSEMTKRLERQQAAHREELDSFHNKVRACSRCRRVIESFEPSTPTSPTTAAATGIRWTIEPVWEEDDEGLKKAEQAEKNDLEKESLKAQITELEQELAQTKLQMVEAKCKIQELEHQKGILTNDLQDAKNTWISKAFTSLQTSGSGGGLNSISIPARGAPALSWNLHRASFSEWKAKMPSWPHRDHREDGGL
ncbi:rab GTPase-activating protein 1-like [Sebastes umbrosus]|uniref:rab GTPase-activating protein 1-like n=1 Tax=Sebastes umbrosus TaxID=72105 RepID=UPI00189CB8FA|nr:rab GTPase-activating protein 1-like [Sebastes umbrosus]